MKNEKKTVINVPHSKRKKIMLVLNTTYPTVKKALDGYTGSELAIKIRHIAITQMGGIEYEIKNR